MKKKLLLPVVVFLFCLAAPAVMAQPKHASAGFRYGLKDLGANLTVRVGKTSGISGIFSSDYSGGRKSVSVFYTEYFTFKNIVPDFSWYAGAGLHAGAKVDGSASAKQNQELTEPTHAYFGGSSLLLGAMYKIPRTPVFISADIKPYVDFFNGDSRLLDLALNLGISL